MVHCVSIDCPPSLVSLPFLSHKHTCARISEISQFPEYEVPRKDPSMTISSSSILLTVTLFFACRCSTVISSHSAGIPVSSLLNPPNHGNSSDRMALLAFRSSIVSDPTGALASWNDSSHFCHWPGITCGHRHTERVIQLSLRSLELSGPVHTSIGNLSFLRKLDLSNNNFRGHIPEDLFHNLLHLRSLNLSRNQLDGEIPSSLGRCRDIQNISFRANSLQGTIPPSLGNLSYLLKLDLTNNRLSGGIPPQLGSISTLKSLVLQQNNLSGIIPSSLGNITALNFLALNNNLLTGYIPPSIGKFRSSLVWFHLWDNRLTGTIPTSIYNLSSIEVIDFSSNNLSGHLSSDLGFVFPCVRNFSVNHNHFSGPIPPSIGNASFLCEIRVGSNSFSGPIPPSIGNLKSTLSKLNLWNNSLTGTVTDSIYNLSSIIYIDLSFNTLSGCLPSDLGSVFPHIKTFDVSRNLFHGTIPPSIVNASSLQTFRIDDNSFTGSIPLSIGMLKSSLSWFSVSNNNLTGMVPTSFYNLSSIVTIDLAGNSLSGCLPSDLGSIFSQVDFLSLYDNKFYGPIPPSIGNASSLSIFQIYSNAFSGTVPLAFGNLKKLRSLNLADNQLSTKHEYGWSFITSLGNCTSLKVLDISFNRFHGSLPHSIYNLSKGLEMLFLSDNRISGYVPEGIGDLVGLTVLDLSDNLFSGAIPSSIGRLKYLYNLVLAGNQLHGEIPASMCNITGMVSLNLSINQLSGAIPLCFGGLQRLQELYLSHNNLSGIIPVELTGISALTTLELAQNSFFGFLPAEIGHLQHLNRLDISHNYLQGEIVITLGDCQDLVFLDISGNNLQGVVPSSFNRLRGMEYLDMSRNNLRGNIPIFFQDFVSLNYLNLSFNNFDGKVPSGGIFQNANAFFISGNPKLCGETSELHLKPCSMKKSNRHHTERLRTIVASSIATFCTIAMVLSIVIILCYSKTKSHPSIIKSNEMLPRLTYFELQKATENFSTHNLIGIGSFANVYRGKLESDTLGSKIVAVKVIKLEQHAAFRSFVRECEVLKNIRHRNLVRILSSCSSIDFQGNDFKALVFEFMPNGSLLQWLHPTEDDQNHERYLNIIQRLNIAVDVASAIDYLHCQNLERIVHCDLKPSNILLDQDMTAHVSDFGIARFLHSKGSASSLSTFKGSIGYVAPEYGMGSNVSTEGDIYSYGILLLEMVTGRSPTDALFTGDLTLHKFVEATFPDRVLSCVDPRLLTRELGINMYEGTSSENDQRATSRDCCMIEEDATRRCLVSLLRLGLGCSRGALQERMPIDVVTKELTAIRETFCKQLGLGTE